MSRTGLLFALLVATGGGLIFGLWPQLDLTLSAPFFEVSDPGLWLGIRRDWLTARSLGTWTTTIVAAPAFLALAWKLVRPRRPMLVPGRAVVLMIATLALAPGLMANVLLKDNWGRPRPIDVTQFKGTDSFVPWWDPRGSCPKNCSFVAGEPSGAFWTMAAAAVAPPPWRALAYGLSIAFGIGIGLIRLAAGGHFASDILFSGVFTFLVVWTTHGLLYRWRSTRITDEQVERALERMRGLRR